VSNFIVFHAYSSFGILYGFYVLDFYSSRILLLLLITNDFINDKLLFRYYIVHYNIRYITSRKERIEFANINTYEKLLFIIFWM
jgi:hypothetical protein